MTDLPPTPADTSQEKAEPSKPELTAVQHDRTQHNRIIIVAVIAIVILALLVTGVILLAGAQADVTSKVRDIFIILMALESIVIGVALVVLITQLATLINLLQNELRPLIKSTRETVDTLRGTSQFLSENVTEPVIKLNEYLAGIKRLRDIFRPDR